MRQVWCMGISACAEDMPCSVRARVTSADPHSLPESALVAAKEYISEAVALRLMLPLHLQEVVSMHY